MTNDEFAQLLKEFTRSAESGKRLALRRLKVLSENEPVAVF